MLEVKRVGVGRMATNCYVAWLPETKHAVVIDPGADAQKIAAVVEERGLCVEAILLTHGHFDHMLAARELKERFGVSVGVCREDAALLRDPEQNVSALFAEPYLLEADEEYDDGQTLPYLDRRLRVLRTPGHTAGSCCYYDAQDGLLFAGDTLFFESRGRTDLPTGSEAQLRRSLRETLFLLPEEVVVYPGHGLRTTIGREKETDV